MAIYAEEIRSANCIKANVSEEIEKFAIKTSNAVSVVMAKAVVASWTIAAATKWTYAPGRGKPQCQRYEADQH
ncbi:hypothetical protein GN958_ATG04578 [Phytophthora infestans]|uniref:Uncharacterized protein n=1 Tax=Phytophthora infestans TaxID=4787 RepID=A0A8S9U373_PHYIN|nr:hypothetical protein GN958_ATG17500 [Phytophthora infestans]KAF4146227.1 hypothetical protein GN958_ATG04578 [Phytophthora infestans]